MKNKKGITIIVLVFTIIIILILTTIVTITGKDLVDSSNKKNFAKEIYIIERKLAEYKFINSELPIGKAITIYLTDVNDKEQFKLEENYSTGIVTLYEIDYLGADIENLSRGMGNSEKDIYLVSKTTNKVYYLKGLKIGKNYYYTLTDDLKESLDI